MNRLSIVILLAGLSCFSVGCVHSQGRHDVASAKNAPGIVAWGQPVNGLQAGLSLQTTRQEQELCVNLCLHLRNVGQEPIKVWKCWYGPSDVGMTVALELRVGETLLSCKSPPELVGLPGIPGGSDDEILDPGETRSVDAKLFPQHLKLKPVLNAEAVLVVRNARAWKTSAEVLRSGPVQIRMDS